MSGPNTKDSKLDRLLRRLTEMDRDQLEFQDHIVAQIDQLYEALRALATNSVQRFDDHQTLRKMVDHVQRLTREKEALVRMIGIQEIERQLKVANSYMGEKR